jgi:hypothetical protein
MSSSRVSMDFSDSGSMSGHEDRMRKRDLVASAATGALASGTGALASGLGWVLGESHQERQSTNLKLILNRCQTSTGAGARVACRT